MAVIVPGFHLRSLIALRRTVSVFLVSEFLTSALAPDHWHEDSHCETARLPVSTLLFLLRKKQNDWTRKLEFRCAMLQLKLNRLAYQMRVLTLSLPVSAGIGLIVPKRHRKCSVCLS